MNNNSFDIVILGGGMVGLSVAHQLRKNTIAGKILIIDKESKLGIHSSGRNSGVLHAGIYYKPNTLKASVCVSGAKRLIEWIKANNLAINQCGKVIVPQTKELDPQLDVLFRRGVSNGAKVEMWDEKQLLDFLPQARSSSGRALWSPNTSVVNPKSIIECLEYELQTNNVSILKDQIGVKFFPEDNRLQLKNNENIYYTHLINCAGLQADKICHKFNIGLDYKIIPFKGSYWKLKKGSPIKIPTNLYPVPDLNVPFLGIHFTPNADKDPIINIGPTASFSWGRENYKGYNGLEVINSFKNICFLAKLYESNSNGFRKYVHEQAFLNSKSLFLRSAKLLIPSLKSEYIEPSEKVGIRAQLFDNKKKIIVNDFLCLEGKDSTHVLNAISPAFTASFSLADLIIKKANLI